MMKKYILIIAILFGFAGCKNDKDTPTPDPVEKELTIRAADLSFLPEIEEAGTIFYDATGAAKDALTIFYENGCNTVRIRLWHTPSTVHSGLAEVISLARRVKAKGMKVWLDIHYSDTWADPATQTKPAVWESLSTSVLADSVYNYTTKAVSLIEPEYVQIGNEINSGFLWDNGSIDNENDFIILLNSGIMAVRDNAPETKIIIHYAGYSTASWFFGVLRLHSVDYDIIGLSYYPAWHGKSLDEVSSALYQLSTENSKEIVIAETAYPFTLSWNDWTNNSVGLESQLITGYPASESGQKAYLLKLKSIIANRALGIGFCYWAPDWVAYRGTTATDGSSWENLTLFDFNNKALGGMELFNP
jgi:arabinogalactan endo-1,4-beta-galactosidase